MYLLSSGCIGPQRQLIEMQCRERINDRESRMAHPYPVS
jgi:hypothetical protein